MTNHEPTRLSRRTLLGAAATVPTLGALVGAGGRAAASEPFTIDADTLVEGNGTFTIALEGVAADAATEATVSVDGIAFAAVDAVDGDPPLLAIDVRNLLGEARIRERDSVVVEVGIESNGDRVVAEDEVRVLTDR